MTYDEVYDLTPAEITYKVDAFRERLAEERQHVAWMTAALTGYAKVPPYNRVFPKRSKADKPTHDIGGVFSALGFAVTRKE